MDKIFVREVKNMSKLDIYKMKRYAKIKQKYPDAEYVYKAYKYNNINFHEKHKLTSWKFLSRLIMASKSKKDLTKLPFPKGTYNPFANRTCASDKMVTLDSTCLALPDSKLLNRKSPEKLVEELSKFDVISFDVFDTCLFRPFAQPTDLYYLLEAQNGILNFTSLRKTAEAEVRKKTQKANFEVDIYDIYEDLATRCFLKKEDAEKEIELEKKVCYANIYMLKVFFLLKKKKKKLIAISDMYLPSKVIKELLEKNGFVGFDKIFVSCEHGFNKSCGELFEIAKRSYPNAKTFAHIGDSEQADLRGAQKAGVQPFYYEQCNGFGNRFRPQSLITPVGSVYKGIVNNYLYNGLNHHSAREEFAFLYAGPIVVGYCEWINEFVKLHDLDKICFLARDMDIFYKIYNQYYKKYDNEYVSASRFSLQECMIEDFTDEYLFHTIDSRADRGYTIERAFNEVGLSFLTERLQKFGLNKNSFIFRSNLEKIHEFFKANLQDVVEHFKDNETAAKLYFKQKIGKAKRICLVDLGWRGSIHAYLRYLLVDKWKLCEEVKGVLFGSTINSASIPLMSRGVVTSYAYNHIHNREYLKTNNWELEYMTMISLESIFTSEENSLVEYRLNKKTKKIEFLTYENNPNKTIIREFHNGIKLFVEEFERFRKHFRKYYPMSAVDAVEPINKILCNYDYLSRIIGDVKDTPYQFAGINIKLDKYVTLGELMLERKLINKWPL